MARQITLGQLRDMASGGICCTDRGNGSAGPCGYISERGQSTESDEAAIDESDVLTLVTADEDSDAWERARDAIRALCNDPTGEPEYVALGIKKHTGEYLESNPWQQIYAA